ncbi:chemotaxis response regulator protein-glutamate methylesterase [Paenibacillus helianthi]|uniref:Protein-glutamate methylesterase/protein-glutamine glutaminase n=1 Tax=Paenibacillus helianthi TaxID=1349432 RepID=A0ABX3EMS8_9BACL|nr:MULTISPECIES: chemotaxis response regulator protein-glutamate methylesterase [Paenibacillus]OKP79039.1 chemotaxis response regulator protein-glutamate methylesterase [Paenibacillus sp. P3E]OKP83803.1 chemotaxis response regulator protein-glutamate methylesterase [Paenibacillus sp. P32E]OKP86352.1 chemotaxis response regulator protein-glutamate methylesterase [Paenibacillus helianthi]
MKPYRVLVVDDSAFMRKIISDLIENDANFQVAATAANGREAIDKVNELSPDLVTMDVEMPEMNGLEALKIIMAQRPLPVIMLSGINEEGMKETILALEWGAFDFIRKPSISNSQDIISVGVALREQMNEAMLARKQREARASAYKTPELPAADVPSVPEPMQSPAKRIMEPIKKFPDPASKLVEKPKVKPEMNLAPDKNKGKSSPGRTAPESGSPQLGAKSAAALSKPASDTMKNRSKEEAKPALPDSKPVPQTSTGARNDPPSVAGDRKSSYTGLSKLVAVGCSTGGPRALKEFLEHIPADFPAPIVIVQHMPPNFTKSLAQRLNTFSPLEVSEAEQGMILRKGAAYIAPGGYHMRVVPAAGGQYSIDLTLGEARNGHRPSVDTLFESILPYTSLERHAVIMTGMGSDGAKMMKSLYDSGVTSTFAESEETCVVYGMPRSAVELHCVRHILPLQEIAPRLVQAVK